MKQRTLDIVSIKFSVRLNCKYIVLRFEKTFTTLLAGICKANHLKHIAVLLESL